MKKPEIYWVVAAGTNFGKTTVSAALIRVLNLLGIPTVGFKPICAVELSEAHCFIEEYSNYNCELSGDDPRKLCNASPLTSLDMADVVSPYYMIYKNKLNMPVFWRIGSRHLGNFSYLKSKYYDNCIKDDAHRRVFVNSSMPIAGAQYVSSTFDSSNQIEAAYQALLRLEPDALVFEGASRFLPVWNSGSSIVANHLIVIARGKLNFIKEVNFCMQHLENRVKTLAHLVKQIDFSQQQIFSLPIHKVLPDQVESYSDSLIKWLLKF